uniref:acyltransferase family protein n=1 Tax=Cellvibrio fontiphilus TaxID=1815559 RepID=UPI002B4BAC5A|nr:acyltransferase [Cellvibrio fontiphilus]
MRLQALDLLRFIAALAVVFYHYLAEPNPSYPALAAIAQYGYLGVPLFFMISGFVIAASAERRNPVTFLISRGARLYPAFWIGVLFTAGISYTLSDSPPSISDILINLTMLNDYLGVKNIDGVYWTLQVELKFYACIFLLMLLKSFHRYNIWLPLWLILTLSNLTLGQPSKMGWFINPGYSCYFISGVCLYLIWDKKHTAITNLTLVISSLLCIVQSFNQAPGFLPNSDIKQGLIAGLIVIFFHVIFLLIALEKVALKPLATYSTLGGITYPLYLLHNHSGKLIIDELSNVVPSGLAIVITTAMMLCLSYLVFRYLEPGGSRIFRECMQSLFSRLERLASMPIKNQKT